MIIPKQFLKTIKRTGLGKNLFFEIRYDNDGKEIKKLDAESLFELELVVGFTCNFILASDCLGDEGLSRGWFFRCVVINDST